MTAAVLELAGVSRRFGDFALRDVSLRVEAGEYWVLLGPSGAGKTLLLHLVAGFHAPDAGRVLLHGRDAAAEPPEARGVGLVFQGAALFPHYDVAGNVAYGLDARRVPAAERRRRLDEVVAALRLEPLLGRPVATLSGGEAQRVAIARALAVRPAILLLDEPLSLLDHNARVELQAELRRLHRELGLTTLHVTHSRDEAQALGDHAAVVMDGRVGRRGPLAEVFARPEDAAVARFLGVEG